MHTFNILEKDKKKKLLYNTPVYGIKCHMKILVYNISIIHFRFHCYVNVGIYRFFDKIKLLHLLKELYSLATILQQVRFATERIALCGEHKPVFVCTLS